MNKIAMEEIDFVPEVQPSVSDALVFVSWDKKQMKIAKGDQSVTLQGDDMEFLLDCLIEWSDDVWTPSEEKGA